MTYNVIEFDSDPLINNNLITTRMVLNYTFTISFLKDQGLRGQTAKKNTYQKASILRIRLKYVGIVRGIEPPNSLLQTCMWKFNHIWHSCRLKTDFYPRQNFLQFVAWRQPDGECPHTSPAFSKGNQCVGFCFSTNSTCTKQIDLQSVNWQITAWLKTDC